MTHGHHDFTRQRTLTALIHAQATDVVVHFTGGWADHAVPLVQRVVLKRTGETIILAGPEHEELEQALADLIDYEHQAGDDDTWQA
jgi:hypothetical protein